MLKYDSIKREKIQKKICDLLNLQEENTNKERPLKRKIRVYLLTGCN